MYGVTGAMAGVLPPRAVEFRAGDATRHAPAVETLVKRVEPRVLNLRQACGARGRARELVPLFFCSQCKSRKHGDELVAGRPRVHDGRRVGAKFARW